MRIIGIDPGMAIVGYCFMDCGVGVKARSGDAQAACEAGVKNLKSGSADLEGLNSFSAMQSCNSFSCETNKFENQSILANCGSIQTDKSLSNSERLLEIHNDLSQLLKTYKPDVAAVEQLFYFKNAKTIMPVSEARGVILMTLKMFDIPVYEYTPLVVKQTITGYGRSEKKEVKEMVKVLLGDEQKIPRLDDTVDAIAIALCHTMCDI